MTRSVAALLTLLALPAIVAATEARLLPGAGARVGEIQEVLPFSAERLFRAIVDCKNYRDFMPFVRASDGELEAAGTLLCQQTLKVPLDRRERSFAIRLTAARRAGGTAIEYTSDWRLVDDSGPMAQSFGTWTLRQVAPDQTFVRLRMLHDLGISPRLQNRATLKSLPWILDGLRQHVRRCRYDQPPAAGCRERPALAPRLRAEDEVDAAMSPGDRPR
ncbi:MAG: hypothetical protein AAF604_12185 [Acidobacteriota bacterium]